MYYYIVDLFLLEQIGPGRIELFNIPNLEQVQDAAPPNALWSVTLSIGMTALDACSVFLLLLIDLIDVPSLLLYK